VLIALGLLRRNGNKIFSKKMDFEEAVCDRSLEKERQKLREMEMEAELKMLKSQYQKKMAILQAKRQLQKDLKEKVDHFKKLQFKNISSTNPTSIE
jgi:methyltransferase-like protein